jgi:hypothetical protein
MPCAATTGYPCFDQHCFARPPPPGSCPGLTAPALQPLYDCGFNGAAPLGDVALFRSAGFAALAAVAAAGALQPGSVPL